MKTFLIVLAVVILIVLVICAYILSFLSRKVGFPIPKIILNLVTGGIAGNDQMPDEYWKNANEKEKWLESQNLQRFEITNKKGMKLKAKLFPSEKQSKVFVLACHGARSSGIGEFSFISKYFHEKGYNLFLVDHRSCGESEGKWMGYGFYESQDTMLWIDFIKKNFGEDVQIVLYGVSMGGATVLMMSGMNLPENVKGIASDCSYTSAWDEFSYQLKTSFHLPAFPVLYIVNFLSIIMAGYSFKKASPIKALKNAKVPIQFFHGEKDDYVPAYMIKQLFDACPTEKEMMLIPDAVHAKSYQTHPDMYEEKFNEFFDRVISKEKTL